jgi:2-haloacid dehalogenase
MTPPCWLTFDCYGTLIDWRSGITAVFREFIPRGEQEVADPFVVWERVQWEMLQEPYVPYMEILERSFEQAMEVLGFRCPRYATESFLDSLGRWEPFPEVSPILIRLSQRYKLAVISNIDRALLGSSLRRLPVRFDVLTTAEDARSYKPDPAIFKLALQKMGGAPEEIAHVAFGADYDLVPAASLGFRCVYLNREGVPRPEALRDVPIEAEIRNFGELPGLWDKRPAIGRPAVATPGPGGISP